MELIKCPKCGESDLERVSDTEYRCKVCGSVVKDNKIAEILEMLKENPDNFIGNLKYNLKSELAKKVLNPNNVRKYAQDILAQNPEDVFAHFISCFLDRNLSRTQFREDLNELSETEMPPYVAKNIANLLIRFYEPAYDKEVDDFINKQRLSPEIFQNFMNAKNAAPDKLELYDTHVERDVFIGCDDDDAVIGDVLCRILEEEGYKCWIESRNYDTDIDKTTAFISATKNCSVKLILNSPHLWGDKWWRNFLGTFVENNKDRNYKDTVILNLEGADIHKLDGMKGAQSIDGTGELSPTFDLVSDAVKKAKDYYLHKDQFESNSKLNGVINSIERKNYRKALAEIYDLLDTSDDELGLRKLLLRIYSETDDVEGKESQINYDRLKEICPEWELDDLENKYPLYVDEQKEFDRGMKEFTARNYQDSLKHFLKGSKKGYAPAINKLGEIYLLGKGIPADVEKGIAYYKKASDLGNPEAQRMLGVNYQLGIRVPKDLRKAFEYFKKGADNGNAFCQLKTADCYRDGNGTSQNPTKAFEYYKMAALQKLPEAARELGFCYKYGKGTIPNRKYASDCLNFASRMGDEIAKKEFFSF